eukprot:scaffold7116_cov296-Pinguiococcus_pyrenoidosus.AAC.14
MWNGKSARRRNPLVVSWARWITPWLLSCRADSSWSTRATTATAMTMTGRTRGYARQSGGGGSLELESYDRWNSNHTIVGTRIIRSTTWGLFHEETDRQATPALRIILGCT